MNESLNSQEKEVLRQRVAAEKKTLTQLEAYYEEALQEIDDHIALLMGRSDANLPNVINHIEYQRMIKAQVQASLDKLQAKEYESIEAYLEDSYTDSFVGTMYSMHAQGVPIITPIDQAVVIKAISIDTKLKDTLYNTLGMDLTKLKKTITSEITRGIASGMQYSEIQRNLSNATGMPLSRARLITRTEAGRVQEAATMDAAYKAMEKGADVVKQWCAVLDSKTRYHHMLLDKQTRELKEPFTIGGKKAMQPHDFGDPAEDCNCRCTVLIRARAALDADELKAMQERASYYGLTVKDSKAFGDAKAKDFSDFKKKYLKASESENKDEPPAAAKVKKKDAVLSIDQENQDGSDAVAKTYAKRIENTGIELISPEEFAKLQSVNYAGIDPRSAEACNKVLKKYEGKYNSWLSGVDTTNDLPINAGAYTEVSAIGGTGSITLNAKQMKNYDSMLENIRINGLDGNGVKVKPGYYDQYIMTHEYGHTLLQEAMTQKSAVGVDRSVYQKAMKEAKKVYADYQQEYHDLSNKVIALKKQEIKLNDAFLDDDADVFGLMEQAKKLVADIKEAEERLASVTISRYANSSIDEFIAEAWTDREIGENPGDYSMEIGRIIDKYFGF